MIPFKSEKVFAEHCSKQLNKAQDILGKLLAVTGARSVDNTVQSYNEISILVDEVGSLCGLMSSVHPEKSLRQTAEKSEQELSQFLTELSLNRGLFQAFQKIDQGSIKDPVTLRLVQKVVKDFERSGVDKDDATRNRIRELHMALTKIGQEFDRNIREDVRNIELESKADLEGLPEDYISAHPAGADGKIRITTQYPDSVPFMMYAVNSKARERLAFESKNRGYPKNESILKDLLHKRKELVNILGYSSWAAYATEDKMVKTDKAVSQFIDRVAEVSLKGSQKEYTELLKEKQATDPKASIVFDYERGFLEERIKLKKYKMDSKEIRSYFDFKEVKQGLLNLISQLFSLTFKQDLKMEVWHSSVEVYEVLDAETKKTLGRIYLDLHPRDGKFNHAAQFTLRSGVTGVQIPEGVLVCNFPDPSKSSGPAFMEHNDVVTFFHEFGHLMHHVLGGHQKWIRFSGVATEWDFVEVPSQLFESWAYEAEVLQKFAFHPETKKTIPLELVQKLRDADEFGKSVLARHQMFYASMALEYHRQDPNQLNLVETLKTLQKKYSDFPYQEGTHFYANFGHLHGYSSNYYTYMWSEVIVRDILAVFKQQGLMNKDLAMKYRKTILEAGGTKDAADLVKDFLGRPYSFDAFQAWLSA